MKVAIIGGGASGLIASIYAKNAHNEVFVFEKNEICGKKILASGNGRCNYFNIDQKIAHYHSSNQDLLGHFITEDQLQEVLNFFYTIGIIPKVKNGYYYPSSNQAISIRNAILFEARNRGVQFFMGEFVKSILKVHDQFQIVTESHTYFFDQVVLATGSSASLSIPSNGYMLSENLGHSIVFPHPSLVQLVSDAPFLKKWAGIRSDAKVSLFVGDDFIKEEFGEVQLTDYGISGICIFNLSRYVSIGLEQGKKIHLKINFLPFIEEDVLTFLYSQNELVSNRTIQELLECLLNHKLVEVLLECAHISSSKHFLELEDEQKKVLSNTLGHFSLFIVGTKGMASAQVSSGGISLEEIDSFTMESKKVPGLYFVGEIVDVDGDCGGYNLSFAFLSGLKAGKSILRKGDEK